ncbi:MioC protein [Mesocricetibacter intestinalis]|uniref:MioC protein n=1 Tax=Mesocricetibacter intestinalis TaxID=1521930 RepID=A0A4R6V9W4_9PAST|nr:FMN-binding protein MioC [Mesocricetibacter intestinalis]TDQ56393.1 MioC protein [Mesocricetibacter intestinalis]
MTKICIITGSTLGAAEYVADHVAEVLQQQGFDNHIRRAVVLDEVIEDKLWLVVTSTHGAGEVPDNLKPLINQIKQDKPDLSHLRFAVIGLGNSDYDTFCYAVNEVESVLGGCGAQQLCPSLKIDVLSVEDHDQCAQDWLPNFTACL